MLSSVKENRKMIYVQSHLKLLLLHEKRLNGIHLSRVLRNGTSDNIKKLRAKNTFFLVSLKTSIKLSGEYLSSKSR